jgi:hypothetical protein
MAMDLPTTWTSLVTGVDFIVVPTRDFERAVDSGVCHQAIFEDPDGNVLDLHHRYAPPA